MIEEEYINDMQRLTVIANHFVKASNSINHCLYGKACRDEAINQLEQAKKEIDDLITNIKQNARSYRTYRDEESGAEKEVLIEEWVKK